MCSFRVDLPTPKKWQKHFSVTRSNAKSSSDHKKRLKEKTQQVFPESTGVDITLETSDALLLVEYGRSVVWLGGSDG
jgi:hypothetical protein